MNQYRKILVIRLSGIGDIVFTLPAVNLIKANYPEAQITFLTKQTFSPLIQGFSGVTNVISIISTTSSGKNIFKICQASIDLIKQLRQNHFDLVVDLHGLPKTGFIAWLTGAPQRWGLVRKKSARRFYTLSLPYLDQHRIDLNFKLLQRGGLQQLPVENRFQLPQSELNQARQLFREWGLQPNQPTIYIQPLTNFARKNWPLANYLSCADYWHRQGFQIIFGGGPKDRQPLAELIKSYPIAAGRANLLTSAALISLTQLVVGGDTGLVHLAVALGKPVLMPLRYTKQIKYYPYAHPEWAVIPDSPNLADLKVPQVLERAAQILKTEVRGGS